MAKTRKKINARLKILKRVRLVAKNDSTMNARKDSLRQAPTRLPPDAGATFKIKLKRKK